MIIIGGGGHGRVIIDLCRKAEERVAAILDDDSAKHETRILGIPVTGGIHTDRLSDPAFLAIGDNKTRYHLAEKLNPPSWKTLIHPSATIADDVQIGEGTVVMAGAVIQTGSRIGRHCIINTGACIDHDCRVGDFVHVGPNCSFGGEIGIEEGTWVGLGSTIVNQVQIGKWAIVGAGSTVTKSAPAEVKISGSPAVIKG